MSERRIKVTFGPPGTGKTTAMLKRVDEYLQQGIDPRRIAFVSYTKKAVTEAATRAAEKFGFDAKELVNFRTIHATAYHALNVRRNEVMGKDDYKVLGTLVGLRFTGYDSACDGLSADSGDAMLSLISYANATQSDLRSVWDQADSDIGWFQLKQVADALREYKNDMSKIDFDDMLLSFVRERPLIDVDAVIIDEAQDLSNLQWDVAKTAFRKAQHIDVAGDDDQAIYGWAGANVRRFLNVKAEATVLNKSYRLPRAVYKTADKILKQIHVRKEKKWSPRDEAGRVEYTNEITTPKTPYSSWLYLARNNYFLMQYEEELTYAGIPYMKNGKSSIKEDEVFAIQLYVSRQRGRCLEADEETHLRKFTKCNNNEVEWFDALTGIDLDRREYYLSCLRNGYKLTDHPKCTVSSIHGVKGGEADNVVLMTDMTARSHDAMDIDADNEHRVFYVGATRARQNLFIMQPQTARSYAI